MMRKSFTFLFRKIVLLKHIISTLIWQPINPNYPSIQPIKKGDLLPDHLFKQITNLKLNQIETV